MCNEVSNTKFYHSSSHTLPRRTDRYHRRWRSDRSAPTPRSFESKPTDPRTFGFRRGATSPGINYPGRRAADAGRKHLSKPAGPPVLSTPPLPASSSTLSRAINTFEMARRRHKFATVNDRRGHDKSRFKHRRGLCGPKSSRRLKVTGRCHTGGEGKRANERNGEFPQRSPAVERLILLSFFPLLPLSQPRISLAFKRSPEVDLGRIIS